MGNDLRTRVEGQDDHRRSARAKQLDSAITELERSEGRICCPQFLSMLAELHMLDGMTEDAGRAVNRGIELTESGNNDYLAELLRIKAQLAQEAGDKLSTSRKLLDDALEVSRAQGALTQEIRVLISAVALEHGTTRESPLRRRLHSAMAGISIDETSHEIMLARQVLAKPKANAQTAAGWWRSLLLRSPIGVARALSAAKPSPPKAKAATSDQE